MLKPALSPARFNADMSFFAKPVNVSDIMIDFEISKVFSIQDKTLDEIRQKVEKFGYDKSQPVVLIEGGNIREGFYGLLPESVRKTLVDPASRLVR